MFGLFNKKKSYPQMTYEMITPDQPINSSDAKRLYKDFMFQIGRLDKDELSMHAEYLSDEIKETTENYKIDISEFQDEIKDLKSEINELKNKLKSCPSNDEKETIQDEIGYIEEDIRYNEDEILKIKNEFSDFKADKRKFLINYINSELGHNNDE
jgi:chromosome segregation ATPase